MTINREKFESELVVAGVTCKAHCADGPQEGRAVLGDGTIVPAGWDGVAALVREQGGAGSAVAALAYRTALLAHVPTETAAQRAARRERLAPVALAIVAKNGYAAAPAWAQGVVDALVARAGEGT